MTSLMHSLSNLPDKNIASTVRKVGKNSRSIPPATKNTALCKELKLRKFILGDFRYRIIDPSLTCIIFSLSQKDYPFMFS